MKRIGLLGGTSWPSTTLYYKRLNELVLEKLGPFHSCPMILHSIDYHHIKSRYQDNWPEIPALLKVEVEKLLSFGPDCLILCNNTLHKALDLIENDLDLQVPLFHIVRLTRDYLLQTGKQKVLLLGTRFTMEDDYFKKPLEEAGMAVVTPDRKDRDDIQEVQTQLSKGMMKPEFEHFFQQILDKYAGSDAVILACTELPLAFDNVRTEMEVISTIELQCAEAVRFSIPS